MTRRKLEILILVGIIVIYFGLVFFRLAEYPPLAHDDVAFAEPAYQFLTQGHFGAPMQGDTYGLSQRIYYYPGFTQFFLMSLSFKLFGLGVVPIKLVSVFMGAVLILMTYLIARKLFSTKVASIAILLLVADSVFFQTARWGRADITAVAFFMLALCLFLQARDRQSSLMFSLSAIALGASIFSHYNGLFLGIPAMYLLFLLNFRQTLFTQKSFWTFSLTLGLVAVPFILYIAPDFSNFKSQFLAFSRYEVLAGFTFYYKQPAALFIIGEVTQRWSGYIVQNSLIFGLFLLAVINGLIKRDESSKLIITVVIAMQVMFVLVKKNGFYLIWMTPLLCILVSSLFVDAFNYLKANSNPITGKVSFFEAFRSNRFVILIAVLLIFVLGFGISGRIYSTISGSDSYDSISSQLNLSVPTDAKVLGPEPFWLALHDRDYRSYYSIVWYAVEKRENTPDFGLEEATLEVINKFKPDYVIYHEKDYPYSLPIRSALEEFFADSQSTKETTIVGSNYYGKIELWKISWDKGGRM